MIVSGFGFQLAAADTSTDQAQSGLQSIVNAAQSFGQSIRERIQQGISDVLTRAQEFLQSLQNGLKERQDQLTSAYSNDTSSASQIKACVQSGQQQADVVANSTSTRSNVINMLTAPPKYGLG
jgi:flagellar biosynthesis chaperone FliJ